MTHEFLMTFTSYITITLRLAWGLYPRSWDHRSHALTYIIIHTDAQVGLSLNEQLRLSFTTHTVTHTLTHHSLYKSSVKVENNITTHIKYLIRIVAQLSNS